MKQPIKQPNNKQSKYQTCDVHKISRTENASEYKYEKPIN